jgi:DNA-directed RNA polymerase specialized sigma24 family protein
MNISARRIEIVNGGDDQLRHYEPDEQVDRGLLERIAARDTQAMYELYLLYHSRVARLLDRISLQSGLVDKMVHDAFLVVWERAGDFRGDTRVATWVYGIAYSSWQMTLRRQMRSPNRGRTFLMSSTNVVAWPFTLLSYKQRAIVEFAYGLGLSREEIAAAMRCPINSVIVRMKYARRRLSALTQPPSVSHAGGDLREATGE